MRKLTLLGATGSIGSSTLRVVEKNPHLYEIFALTANTNVNKMVTLCQTWQPKFAAMAEPKKATQLRIALKEYGCKTEVLSGLDGICALACHPDADTVMAAIVGGAGLAPTLAAAKAGKRVLLANKEALVMSGQLFINAVHQHGAQLLPVDSEHNAIFQCLPQSIQSTLGRCDLKEHGISSILLTGSGGPFRYTSIDELSNVTPAQAINHPNWSMGPKISVDSATMMNKGLEYIEAKWLFNATRSQLDVIIHPQSVIHSMVQYRDGSVLAQMGCPDMCIPIAHAMAYPSRIESSAMPLNFNQLSELTFIEPDFSRYPCLKLAIEACYEGQSATTSLNAANEIAVDAFLKGQIDFVQIAQLNDAVLQQVALSEISCIESLFECDFYARSCAKDWLLRFAS